MVRRAASGLLCCAWIAAAAAADGALPPDGLDVRIAVDAAGQSGSAEARVRIHASRERIWSLITSCTEALTLIPGLVDCEVLETAPDGSSQLLRHVVDYSWIIPKLSYELRARYDKPAHMSAERIAGNLQTLKVDWDLSAEGDYTMVEYSVALTPGFWVPRWLVGVALKRDLPKMLRALKTRAESGQ